MGKPIKFRSLKIPVQHEAKDGTIYWVITDMRKHFAKKIKTEQTRRLKLK